MKKQVIFSIALVFTVIGCNPTDDSVVTASDRQFIQSAYQRNLLDIQNSQIVRTRGTNEPIKRFSQMLISQASQNQEELLDLAQKREIQMAVELQSAMQQEVSTLLNTPMEQFEDTYLAMIIQSRKKAISMYEGQIRDGKDNALREWASKKISGFKKELENAESLIDQN
jgi:putative membrane protein